MCHINDGGAMKAIFIQTDLIVASVFDEITLGFSIAWIVCVSVGLFKGVVIGQYNRM